MSNLPQPLPPEFARALRELDLVGDEALTGMPLTGGVSSEIWRIQTARGPLCVKRALLQLRVAADWRAPIERNAFEARWMQVAETAVPGCTPRLRGQHAALGVLAMSYLPSDRYPLWKRQLRDGVVRVETARAVGSMLGRIHAHAAARPELAAQFDSAGIFFELRLDPYLLATAAKHAEHAPALRALVEQTQANTRTLVHGDVSPKNILVGTVDHAVQPVLLDAECACWGDPAFDLAFVLNHLLLKCLWVPAAQAALLACFDALASTYLQQVGWEPVAVLESRAAALLPALMLARVDGKSPVEYLTADDQRDRVRRCAAALLRERPSRLSDVAQAWRQELALR